MEKVTLKPVQPEYCDPSLTVYNLAKMVMSDCGHSSNNQRLLDRIANRIQRHIDATSQHQSGEYDWIEWNGGGRPGEIHHNAFIAVKRADGKVTCGSVVEFQWLHGKCNSDIVAYHVFGRNK